MTMLAFSKAERLAIFRKWANSFLDVEPDPSLRGVDYPTILFFSNHLIRVPFDFFKEYSIHLAISRVSVVSRAISSHGLD